MVYVYFFLLLVCHSDDVLSYRGSIPRHIADQFSCPCNFDFVLVLGGL